MITWIDWGLSVNFLCIIRGVCVLFDCEQCGCCCRNIGKASWAKNMALPNGECKYLDQTTNLCTIYKIRPIFCNVKAFYVQHLIGKIAKKTFYTENKKMCRRMRKSMGDVHSTKTIISANEVPEFIRKKIESAEKKLLVNIHLWIMMMQLWQYLHILEEK